MPQAASRSHRFGGATCQRCTAERRCNHGCWSEIGTYTKFVQLPCVSSTLLHTDVVISRKQITQGPCIPATRAHTRSTCLACRRRCLRAQTSRRGTGAMSRAPSLLEAPPAPGTQRTKIGNRCKIVVLYLDNYEVHSDRTIVSGACFGVERFPAFSFECFCFAKRFEAVPWLPHVHSIMSGKDRRMNGTG